MGVLNELIGAVSDPVSTRVCLELSHWDRQVKFIKFFAWEEQWIGRASEARAGELSWMTKSEFYVCW